MLLPTLFRLEVVQDNVVDKAAHKVVDRRLPKLVDRVHQSPLQAHHHQTRHLQAQLLPTLDKVCKFQQCHAHVLHVSDPTIATATNNNKTTVPLAML